MDHLPIRDNSLILHISHAKIGIIMDRLEMLRAFVTVADQASFAVPTHADTKGGSRPCVDGSPLASLNIRLAVLVGAAMCPTCCCGAWCR
ncbi:MAG: hypothetical protein ABI240_06435, partial [Sphingomonas sp.]